MIDIVSDEFEITYDPVQVEAIKAMVNPFYIITGGPGTGKSTIIKAIVSICHKLGKKVLMAAPTGRAAKRMTEICGLEAYTIHRLLDASYSGFGRNDDNPIECDVIIVDESSMIDILLMNNFLKAVKNGTAIILIGDVDQLPSIGPGNVLSDLINSDVIPVIKLKHTFRQAKGSKISYFASQINKEIMPELENSSKNDLFFISSKNTCHALDTLADLVSKRLPNYYKVRPTDIQVISPMRIGEAGTINLNKRLQQLLNNNPLSLNATGIHYRLHDRVIQIKNNYDKHIYNDDIGEIISVDKEEQYITVNYDGTLVNYDINELHELELAYALSVHKAQGGEFGIVVFLLTGVSSNMIHKQLLYTGITRAKRGLIILGSEKNIFDAINTDLSGYRNRRLERKLGSS